MPRITITTNTPVSFFQQKNIMEGVKKAIEKIPREKGEYVMCVFEEKSIILFGDDLKKTCACIDTAILGDIYRTTPPEILEEVLHDITMLVHENCSIEPGRIYAYYSSHDMWALEGVDIRKTFLSQ